MLGPRPHHTVVLGQDKEQEFDECLCGKWANLLRAATVCEKVVSRNNSAAKKFRSGSCLESRI